MRKPTDELAMNEEQPMGEKKGAMKRGGEGQFCACKLPSPTPENEICQCCHLRIDGLNLKDYQAGYADGFRAAAPAMKRDHE